MKIMRSYAIDTKAAKEADQGRITETGKYVGSFTRAEAIVSKKNSEGVEFTFKSDAGGDADFLTLWTHNADGKELHGFKVLNAILTCMKIRSIAPTEANIEKWVDGGKQTVKAQIFKELMGPKIGVLLQREEYAKNDGSVGSKLNIASAFEAGTDLTASEILDKATKAVKLAPMVAALRDKLLLAQATASRPAGGPAPAPAFDDGDIPF